MGYDLEVGMAASAGNLELNAFLPVLADSLLNSVELLTNACDILRRNCIQGLKADEARCRSNVENSTASATALLPAIGHEKAVEVAEKAREQNRTIREVVVSEGLLSDEEFDHLIAPETVMRLGSPSREQ